MFPIRKSYIKEIIDEKGNKTASLKFEQATVYERYEFATAKNPNSVLFKFIDDNIEFITKRNNDKREIILQIINQDFINDIVETRFKLHDSIFKGWRGRKWIEQASIVFVCKELWIEPHDLIHNYTMEEYQFYLDGVVYNMNEWSKEGRLLNDRAKAQNSKENKAIQDKFKKAWEILDKLDK